MDRWTERRMLAVVDWLDEQWNSPSREDYYSMQLAAILCKVNSKHPDRFTTNSMKIRFQRAEESSGRGGPDRKRQAEFNLSLSKATWARSVGLKAPPAAGDDRDIPAGPSPGEGADMMRRLLAGPPA